MRRAVGSTRAVLILALGLSVLACDSTGGESARPTATQPTAEAPSPAGPVYEGALHVDSWVRVEGASDCLNFGVSPGEGPSPINFCQPDGFEGYLSGGPTYADGSWWWAVAGQGWAPDDYLRFVRDENLSTRVAPDLAGLGLIAFVGPDGDAWVMGSDGSDRRRLVAVQAADARTGIGVPQWRPDGQQFLIQESSYGEAVGDQYRVRIVDLQGRTIREIEDAASAFWSSDGTRLGLLYNIQENGLGALRATPGVLNLASGDVTPIGPEAFYGEGPKWRDAAELVYEDEQGVHLVHADGSDDRVIAPATLRGAHVPSWSPDGTRLSLESTVEECRGYIILGIDGDQIDLCAPLPPLDSSRGGRGGWSEDGQTDWSPDGRLFAYHTEWAVVNQSGVYVVDAASGQQTLLPGWEPAYTSFAADGRHIVFETQSFDSNRSYIWVGDAATGSVALLAEGREPAWQPVLPLTAGR